MSPHPWDQRDLAQLCAEEDNGIERSQARRAERERISEWRWMLLGALIAAACFYLLAAHSPF